MEQDFDTFDPSEALVDEGRNLYYPANWQKGDPVFILNEPVHDTECVDYSHGPEACACICHEPQRGAEEFYELEQRKGLDCE